MSDESQSEADRSLEQHALRNTRALVDMLETDEAARRRRQGRALWIIALVALVPIGVAAIWALKNPKESLAEKKLRDCEIDARSARAREVTEQIRAENPGMTYREIVKKIAKEHGDFSAEAREKCRDETTKAGK